MYSVYSHRYIQIQDLLTAVGGTPPWLTATTSFLWSYWAMWSEGIGSNHPAIDCPLLLSHCRSSSPRVVSETRNRASPSVFSSWWSQLCSSLQSPVKSECGSSCHIKWCREWFAPFYVGPLQESSVVALSIHVSLAQIITSRTYSLNNSSSFFFFLVSLLIWDFLLYYKLFQKPPTQAHPSFDLQK